MYLQLIVNILCLFSYCYNFSTKQLIGIIDKFQMPACMHMCMNVGLVYKDYSQYIYNLQSFSSCVPRSFSFFILSFFFFYSKCSLLFFSIEESDDCSSLYSKMISCQSTNRIFTVCLSFGRQLCGSQDLLAILLCYYCFLRFNLTLLLNLFCLALLRVSVYCFCDC